MLLKTFKGGEIARLPTPSFGNGAMWDGCLAGIWQIRFIDKYMSPITIVKKALSTSETHIGLLQTNCSTKRYKYFFFWRRVIFSCDPTWTNFHYCAGTLLLCLITYFVEIFLPFSFCFLLVEKNSYRKQCFFWRAQLYKCAISPDDMRGEISFSRTCNIPNLRSYIYRIALFTLETLHSLCIYMVEQLHAH